MKRLFLFSLCLITSFALWAQKEQVKTATPVLAPPPKVAPEKIYTVAEKMPQFPGCEHLEDRKERRPCSDKKMLEYIYKNLQYPDLARQQKIEGTVVIRFFINKEGQVKDASIVKDIGSACGEEALRVINSMPRWKPGTHRRKKVNVYYNIPIRFKL